MPTVTRQELIYYPDEIRLFDGGERAILDVPVCPTRLYTLAPHRDPDDPPTLPINTWPRAVWHNDRGHDWRWAAGKLRYGSCPVGGKVWLLMEFDDR